MTYTFIVPEEYNQKKLQVFLRSGCSLSSALIRSVKFSENGLLVDGVRAKTNQILVSGQQVTLHLPLADSGLSVCDVPVPVVYESRDVIIFNKPAGMATHPTLNHPDGTLANVYAAHARKNGDEPVFRPINRLDKNTSGLVLAAKSRLAAPLLAQSVRKKYLALCEGSVEPDYGGIDAPIGRAGDSIIQRVVCDDGAPSKTRYRVLARQEGYTILAVETLTGRTHQIRVHMAHIGHPLVGDTLYGGQNDRMFRHALHCGEMSFTEPLSHEDIAVECAPPDDMSAWIL